MKCWVHQGKPKYHGYFYWGDQVGPKHAWSRIIVDGEEFHAEIKLNKIIASQRAQKLEGRFFGVSSTGRIHLCRCRWTKEMIAEARKSAAKLLKEFENV